MLEIIGPPNLEPREKVLLEARGPCYDHLCYTADDVPTAWEEAAARGSVQVEAPIEAYDNCLAWLRDADGNDIEVMGAVPPETILEAIRMGVPYDSTRSSRAVEAAIPKGE
jgi:hypothetical protein